MDTPSGPAGRRARWHEVLSKFDLTVQYVPGKENVVADAMSRFAYPACKAFQDVSVHGSAKARDDVKRIIAEELAEARTVGMIIRNGEADLRCRHVMLVCGTVARWKELPSSRVRVVTRSGRDSELNPDAEPFVPQVTTGLDETGNDMSAPMWRPGKGTGRGKSKN